MKSKHNSPDRSITAAVGAIHNLAWPELEEIINRGQMQAMIAHDEITHALVNQKCGIFYRYFVPIRNQLIQSLANSYRRYLKVAFAHLHETGKHPDQWAWNELQPAVGAVLEWICDWYTLACDGENQYVRREASLEFVPGQTVSIPISLTSPSVPPPESWRAPSWLFQVAPSLGFIRPLKAKHVPDIQSNEKLGAAYSRLIIKLARRIFLWALEAAIEKVLNEEIAAAGAVPVARVVTAGRGPNKRDGWQQKQKLYGAIRKILTKNPNLQGIDFCAELDKFHAPPLRDWEKSAEWRDGLTWKEAWQNPKLCDRIRRVRQEAMKTR